MISKMPVSTIIMMAGLPGTGKSTVAKKLENMLNYHHISFLEVRRNLGYKRYNHKKNIRAFEEFNSRAMNSVINNNGVILDLNYLTLNSRKGWYEIAIEDKIPLIVLECYCSEETAKKRMKERPKNDGLVVESRNPKVYDTHKNKWEDIENDFFLYKSPMLNYIKYDSKANKLESIVVNLNVSFVVSAIYGILEYPASSVDTVDIDAQGI